ncbi:antibiotic biosynthesis monooxygenase [Flavobacteriaceae bacterium]|jgi:heme-degrading monooxygenase HmoA|nr:antibiotic biosynthesis monooxygenase [Flavobacteriaceae bacterium]MDA7710757.1 antibiotic biosynthesis monooxygenase [Flavobacteriaceae bacterium]MDA8969881.1 antibiotic biosynthesis monooxygenase [bacterium]MDA8993246.1 antibiotic biosynthesis monooxygenase [Flavobacteriaceae bacterium]
MTKFAVVFETELNSLADEDYLIYAKAMEDRVATAKGFLGMESHRFKNGKGVTISYWESKTAIAAWGKDPHHQKAQNYGKTKAYKSYTLKMFEILT